MGLSALTVNTTEIMDNVMHILGGIPDEFYFSFEMNHNRPYKEYHGIRYAPTDEPIDGELRYEQARKSVTGIRYPDNQIRV